jgi:hypothetical protein
VPYQATLCAAGIRTFSDFGQRRVPVRRDERRRPRPHARGPEPSQRAATIFAYRFDVRCWPIVTFRGDATLRSLSERSGHSASRDWKTKFMSTRPSQLRIGWIASVCWMATARLVFIALDCILFNPAPWPGLTSVEGMKMGLASAPAAVQHETCDVSAPCSCCDQGVAPNPPANLCNHHLHPQMRLLDQ